MINDSNKRMMMDEHHLAINNSKMSMIATSSEIRLRTHACDTCNTAVDARLR